MHNKIGNFILFYAVYARFVTSVDECITTLFDVIRHFVYDIRFVSYLFIK